MRVQLPLYLTELLRSSTRWTRVGLTRPSPRGSSARPCPSLGPGTGRCTPMSETEQVTRADGRSGRDGGAPGAAVELRLELVAGDGRLVGSVAAGQATRTLTVGSAHAAVQGHATGGLAVGSSVDDVTGTVTLSVRPWLVPVTRKSYAAVGRSQRDRHVHRGGRRPSSRASSTGSTAAVQPPAGS